MGSSRTGALLLGVLFVACNDADDANSNVAAAWFTEVGTDAGIAFEHVAGFEQRYYFPEIMGGGVGLVDYDGDGRLDVYLVQSGDLAPGERPLPTNRLLRNLGGLRFEDVTDAAGAADDGYGMGVACGDYDGDGDADLYVTNVGSNALYRNDDGRFTDVTVAAAVGHAGWGTSAAFLDYDGDGHLDLFVTNYLRWSPESEMVCHEVNKHERDYCNPNNYKAPAPDVLYRNLGDGTFEDVSERAGLAEAFGNGLGVVTGDFDGDGHLDIYVANDFNANQLWINDGAGHFTDKALLFGCALNGTGYAESGMGIQALDLEGDGDLDLFMTHLRSQSNTLYVNESGLFRDATIEFGLSAPSLPFTGFGMGFADFDLDADLDCFVANGRVMLEEPFEDPTDPYAQANLLFAMDQDGRFQEVLPRGGASPALIATSRGAAFGDLDDDGDVDVIIGNRNARPHLLRNDRGRPGPSGRGGHWVTLRVLDAAGADAVGSVVRVRTPSGEQWRRVDPAYGYCSSNDPRVHFGLGAEGGPLEVLVRWPDGTERTLTDVEADRQYVVPAQAKSR